MDGLSDEDLRCMAGSKKLSALSSCFAGVFSKDEVPDFRHQEGCAIVNLETSDLPGSHWVSCGNKKGQGWYFDSFGLDIPGMIAHKLPANVIRVKRVIQADNSDLCGLFALGACNEVAKHANVKKALRDFEALFQQPVLDTNDVLLYQYFQAQL